MKNFEVKFSLLKTVGLSLVFALIGMIILPIILFSPSGFNIGNVNDIAGVILFIATSVVFLFFLRRALYRKAIISGNEKGVQLTYFYTVFIPWEDIENIRFVSGFNSENSRKDVLIIMLKDNDIYVNEYIKEMSKSAMQRKIRRHLSPIAIDTSLFETTAESVQELLEKGLQEYKAKAAGV